MSRERPGARITVAGTVQGVGFRPFVYRQARRLNLCGTIRNTPAGVVIEAFGDATPDLVEAIRTECPPLAAIRSLDVEKITGVAPVAFTIEESTLGDRVAVDVSRDVAVCPACLREMQDPANRRFRHAFINCTDCGPRYTIIRGLPYDRPQTTMADFEMCVRCRREYDDPANRRFHAQPVCCPDCGPRLRLLDAEGCPAAGDPVEAARQLLSAGKIAAVKGIGGFHLACRADDAAAVARLRQRKQREEKPLAVMVRDIVAARGLAEVSGEEQRLLEGVERPIVILRRRDGAPVAREVAPRVPTIGIMLPYAPLHHLLFAGAPYEALVMTSANVTDEPMIIGNDEARSRLAGIADAFLVHDRNIYIRNDDSIARVMAGAPVLLRRGRGFVPAPLPAGCDVDGIVAWGGILKGTVTVGRGECCYTSQYLGAVETVEALHNLEACLAHLTSVLGVAPRLHVCDLHPYGLTTQAAQASGLPLVQVQHHFAHAAACLAENRHEGDAIALIYDGTGLGCDNTIWGGEVLRVNRRDYLRLGHLSLMPMPGGDGAVEHPGRMALGALWPAMGMDAARACSWMPEEEKAVTLAMLQTDTNCPQTSSMGRLFDACAAVLDICRHRTYEGQPAMELEGCADRTEAGAYEMPVFDIKGDVCMDGSALLEEVLEDRDRGTSVPAIAAKFHHAVADASVLVAKNLAQSQSIDTVCLSGGCFQNALLAERTIAGLRQAGLRVLVHRLTPPNDECISYGQAVVAGERRRTGLVRTGSDSQG